MAWILEKIRICWWFAHLKHYLSQIRSLLYGFCHFSGLSRKKIQINHSVNTPTRWRQKVWYTELKQLDNQMCCISRWGGSTTTWLLNAVQHIFSWETKWKTPQYWSLLVYLIISNCILTQKLCNSIVKIAFAVRNLSKTKWQMLIEFGNSYYKHKIYEQKETVASVTYRGFSQQATVLYILL